MRPAHCPAFLKLAALGLMMVGGLEATTVTGTVTAADGSPAAGSIYITASSTFTAPGGAVVSALTTNSVTVTAGAFSVNLVANDTGTPAGTFFRIRFQLTTSGGVASPTINEIWRVPTSSSPVDFTSIRSQLTAPLNPSFGISFLTGGLVKGDLIAYNGTSFVRQAKGTDGQCLQTLTAAAAGLAWGTCGGGGGTAFNTLSSGNNTSATMTVGSGALMAPLGTGTVTANLLANVVTPITGVVKATSGVPSAVTGTATDCVLVNGSSGSCGTATTGLVLTSISTTAGSVSTGSYQSNITTYNITGFDWQRISWNVTGVSGTTDITITVGTAITGWIRAGDSLYLQGFTGGCAPLNGLQANLTTIGSTTFHVAVALPSCTYGGTGGTAGVPPTGANGQIQVCGEPNGTIQFFIDSALGMELSHTAAAQGTVLQGSGNPTNCVGTAYRGIINIVNGLVASVSPNLAILGGENLTPGDGLADCSNASTKCVKVDSSICRTTIGCAILSTFDATAATSSKPFKTVAADPGTCAFGEAIANSTSNLFKGCAPANTWTTFAAAGSAYDPMDLSTRYLVDTFSGTGTTTGFGDLNWVGTCSGSGSTVTNVVGEAGHSTLKKFVIATSGDGCAYYLFNTNNSNQAFANLTGTTGWGYKMRVKTGASITGLRLFLGLSEFGTITTNTLGVEYTTGDTTFMCTQGNGAVTRTTVGPTVAINTWYEIYWYITTANTVSCQVNGGSVVNVSGAMPTSAMQIYWQILAGAGATSSTYTYMDSFAFKMPQ